MGKAIQLPFSIDSSGGVASTSDDAKIWQDRVVSVVMTRFGERVMNPIFGSSVANATFFNTNEAAGRIQEAVDSAFATHLPSLTLNSIQAYEDPADESGVLTVVIAFSFPQLLSQTETTVSVKTQYLSRSGDVLLEVGNAR